MTNLLEQDWQLVDVDAQAPVAFADFNLPEQLIKALDDLNFVKPTPIQAKALEYSLIGRDFIGRAQTGTGKTAAFLLSIMTYFIEEGGEGNPSAPRALILVPTRELALQIKADADKLSKYLDLNIYAIFGGIDYDLQLKHLKGKIDILIATPGRLLDFVNKRQVFLSGVEIFVLDEADRMLDMGFINSIKRIMRATPPKKDRQTMLFSATFAQNILKLANSWTQEAFKVSIKNSLATSPNIKQYAFLLSDTEKLKVLKNILHRWQLDKVIIFANRRDRVKHIYKSLSALNSNLNFGILSGDIDQKKRIDTLNKFKQDKIQILVATDVAGRGLHINDISHVINYNLPEDAEDYLHRIGRTGRAGMSGTSVSFIGEEDAFSVNAIEVLIDKKLEYNRVPVELLED